MKIAIIGNTGGNIKNAYSWFIKSTYDGFSSLGHEVIGIDYKTSTYTQIKEFLISQKPNFIFTHLTFHNNNWHDKFQIMELFDEMRRLYDMKFIHTMQDARHEPRFNQDISHAFDLALVGQTENIEKFQKYWNIPVYYWPYSSLTYSKMAGYHSNLAFSDPVFTGSAGSHKDRSAFIKKLQSLMPIKIIGTGSKYDLRNQTPELSVSAQCILGLCTGYDIAGYLEVRPWQYLGTGACMIMRKFKDMDNIIPKELYYSIDGYSWNDAKQVKEVFEEIKKTNTWPMRKEAFNFIQKYHSSKVRMKQTLELIEEKRDSLDIYLK